MKTITSTSTPAILASSPKPESDILSLISSSVDSIFGEIEDSVRTAINEKLPADAVPMFLPRVPPNPLIEGTRQLYEQILASRQALTKSAGYHAEVDEECSVIEEIGRASCRE